MMIVIEKDDNYDDRHSQGVYMPPSTRQTMIAGAASLLARRGMGGTSFSELLAATGAPRGSLYHHFPGGKEELIAEATRYVGDRLLAGLGVDGPCTPADLVEQFTSLWRRVLTGSDFEAGCGAPGCSLAIISANWSSRRLRASRAPEAANYVPAFDADVPRDLLFLRRGGRRGVPGMARCVG